MPSISIQLPNIEADHKIEIEVKINGNVQKLHYRVEILEWNDEVVDNNRAVFLKEKISKVEDEWQLVQIGQATKEMIPVMFKHRPVSGRS